MRRSKGKRKMTEPAKPIRLAEGLRLVRAPNPSAMTLSGTNTYILGEGSVAVIDPGPRMPVHLDAILRALAPGETISHIFVTHAHLDHSPLAAPLAELTGAPVLAFGRPEAGRSAVMAELAAAGLAGGGEGVDAGFVPHETLADGTEVSGDGWRLCAAHTPGHFCNHLSFVWADAVFTGDHVMGWASTLISPPDGDLGDYFRSLDRLRTQRARVFYPGHGDPVTATGQRIDELAAHRVERTRQIRAHLALGPATPAEITRALYTDTPAGLLAAAERNVFAHLIDLVQKNLAIPETILAPSSRYRAY